MNNYQSPSGLLPRAIGPTLAAALATHPVVVLIGARQTGKSTLATVANGDRLFLALDERDLFDDAISDPATFVGRAPRMTIDEVQRVPDLLHAIKRAVDVQRPREPGRFLLTGSANLALMRNVSESLAGRALYITVWPMSRREVLGFGATGIWSDLFTLPRRSWYDHVRSQEAPAESWAAVARRGGYPVPAYEYETDEARQRWFRGYVATYLRRDVPELAPIEHGPEFQRLMRALALRIGGLQNQSEVARDLGLAQPTVYRYMNLLDTSYQLIRLPAYTVNRTSRLIKAPKVYWSDTGLAMALSREQEPRGEHFENIVLADLLAWRETVSEPPEIMYWRTASGHEVDFVIESATGSVLAVEVKATLRPTTRMIAGMRAFLEEHRDRAVGGLVLHGGDETFWIAADVLAAPWWQVI
jgi:uncharacterized protein